MSRESQKLKAQLAKASSRIHYLRLCLNQIVTWVEYEAPKDGIVFEGRRYLKHDWTSRGQRDPT